MQITDIFFSILTRKDFKINKLILKSPTPLELVLFWSIMLILLKLILVNIYCLKIILKLNLFLLEIFLLNIGMIFVFMPTRIILTLEILSIMRYQKWWNVNNLIILYMNALIVIIFIFNIIPANLNFVLLVNVNMELVQTVQFLDWHFCPIPY